MDFKKFVSSLVYFLESLHEITVKIKSNSENEGEAFLILKQDGQDHYVGNNTDPGAFVEWVGRYDFKDDQEDLVRVNGIILSANGRAVAGFIAGFQ